MHGQTVAMLLIAAALPVSALEEAEPTPRTGGQASTESPESRPAPPEGAGRDPDPVAPPAPTPLPAFAGELDVTVINLFVTVVDRRGRPVRGLTREHFAVFDHDQPVELTHFAEINRMPAPTQDRRRLEVGAGGEFLESAIGPHDESGFVALLFDNLSLEKRHRKRAVRSIGSFIERCVERHDQILVATVGEDFRILEPFTADAERVAVALDAVLASPSFAAKTSNQQRVLRREILTTTVLQNEASLFGPKRGGEREGPSLGDATSSMPGSAGDSMAIIRATRLLGRLDRQRRLEQVRILGSLQGIDEMVRSLAAMPGRKHLVWIGEGLVTKPGIQTYQVYYNKFQEWSGELNLDPPDIWSREATLVEHFDVVAAAAQVAGTTLHLVDASDRDSEIAASSFMSTDSTAFLSAEEGGNRVAADYDIHQSDQIEDGAQLLATATGGTYTVSTRDLAYYFDGLDQILGSYYSIGYGTSGSSDGVLRPVRVDLNRRGLSSHVQQRVAARSPAKRLVDSTMSRLRFGEGNNPIQMAVTLGSVEPIDEDRYIQLVRVVFPTDRLQLVNTEDGFVDQLLLAFQSLDARGFSRPPQLMQISISIPSDRLSPGAVARASARLVMGSDTRRLAVGVHESTSGVQATTALDIEPPGS